MNELIQLPVWIYILSSVGWFASGFGFSIALVSKVSIRPKAKAVLKRMKVVKEHKAIVPRAKVNPGEEIIQ